MIDASSISEKSIYAYKGKNKGKTVAIFAGVHGNERAGIDALSDVVENMSIQSGALYCVFANPEAIEKNVREIHANLNRCFMREIPITLPEHKRANELMDILDTCDALLDLHSSNSKKTTPFIICEENGLEYAKFFNFPIVSTGWGTIEPGGSESYMNMRGKIGITLECGSVHDISAGLPIAANSIATFLQLWGMTDSSQKLSTYQQTHIQVIQCIRKQTEKFAYVKEFKDFEKLPEGKMFAVDHDKKYVAGKNQVIIFPRPKKPIGGEAGIIGETF